MGSGIGGSTAEAELAALASWPHPAPAITGAERADRMRRAQALMAELGADALIIGAGAANSASAVDPPMPLLISTSSALASLYVGP